MTPDIAAMVDDYIESVTDERLPDGKFHPSSMFGCDRKTVYEVRGTPPSNATDAKTKRRFWIGHRLHESVQRALEAHPAIQDFYPEAEIDVPAYNLLGHADGVVRYNGQWWLLEVKSIKKMGLKFGIPKDDHVKQAVAYWWAIKHYGFNWTDPWARSMKMLHPPVDVVGILMVYLEKEELAIHQVNLEPEDWWETLVPEKVSELQAWVEDDDSLPPRLPRDKNGKKNWLCGYCPLAKKCWDEDPAVVPFRMEEY